MTGGARLFRLWLLSAIPLALVALVNTTSVLMEDPPGARGFEAWEPALWEGSSALLLFALVPLVWRWLQRWPIQPPWVRPALVHLALTVPFSLIHVAGMVAIRHIGYRLMGGQYDFLHEGLGITLLYEWRKDLVSYGLLLLILSVIERLLRGGPAPTAQEPLLSLRADGAVVHLRPSEIRLVEAAGNYVEFDVGGRRHLVRMTLAAAAELLGPGFAQVHRSRLVNLAQLRSERPQPSGDVLLLLADGSSVMASRRYRDRLPSARRIGPGAS